jgi:predicted nucleotidyltransferase
MTIKDIKDEGLLLFECISGSRAYGLDTPRSDTDIKGVFYLPKQKFYGLDYVGQVNNETNDEVYYELGRFVELLIKNNPNLLESLASPADCILFKHPLMNKIDIRMFLSKLCKDSFAGYAFTQIQKARGYKKKIVNPVDKQRKSVLDFCFVLQGHSSMPAAEWLSREGFSEEHCGLSSIAHTKGLYALFYDKSQSLGYNGIMRNELANQVSLSSIPKNETLIAYLFFNLESYSSYCKEYREYWEWVEKRSEDRYLSNRQHGKDYDAKNMMHTIRLLQTAAEILEHGTLNVHRTNREELLSIKSGELEYDQLLDLSNTLMERINTAYLGSTLPDTPNVAEIEKILIEIRSELYK